MKKVYNVLLVIIGVFLFGCADSGGDGNTSTKSAPTLLSLNPNSQAVDAGATSANFTVNFTFTDPDGNLNGGKCNYSYSGTAYSIDLGNDFAGITNGQGFVNVSINPNSLSVGNITLPVWLSDSTGLSSNTINFTLSVLSRWTNAAPMSTERYRHTATLLQDGRVLVVGGDGLAKLLNTSEIYNPSTNIWTNAASMSAPRSDHTATLLNNGKVLVAGGRDTTGIGVSPAQLYDPITDTWSNAGDVYLVYARGFAC